MLLSLLCCCTAAIVAADATTIRGLANWVAPVLLFCLLHCMLSTAALRSAAPALLTRLQLLLLRLPILLCLLLSPLAVTA
jgi:hypothetical protein